LLAQLAYDPATQTQRLGDGFYEQKLIRTQVAELTGRRFLGDFTDAEAQYRALLEAGAAFAQAYQLVPGVSLTDAQMAALTSDIVWLVSREVQLADGRVHTVLVPQLCALVDSNRGVVNTIDLISEGGNLNAQLTGNFFNSVTPKGVGVRYRLDSQGGI
jgi:filamentous hemagglutinin